MSAWSATARRSGIFTRSWAWPPAGRSAASTAPRSPSLTPWALPPAEDLARGADVEAVDAHTVALVPLGAKTRRTDDDKPAPYYRLKLLFADDGRLVERRLEEAPAGKVVLREVYDDNGGVRVLDADGKELGESSQQGRRRAGAGPVGGRGEAGGAADAAAVARSGLRGRGPGRLAAARRRENGCYSYWQGDQAVELLAGAMTEGNADEAQLIFRDCFAAHGDLRRGLFTLLSAAGANVCTEPAFQAYLSDHKDDPLARYFALLGNAGYDFLHRWTRTGPRRQGRPGGQLPRPIGGVPRPGNALAVRCSSSWVDAALRRADEGRTFDFIRRNHDNVLGWALQIHVQDQASGTDARLRLALAETWGVLAGDDGSVRGPL